MKILILIVIALISIQEWITRRRLRKVRRLLGKVECAKHTLPTGEVETLGPGKVLIFDKQKVGTITGISLLRNEELGANLDEAEKLLKEAKEKKRKFN